MYGPPQACFSPELVSSESTPAMAIALDKAELVAMFLESLLFGAFAVLYFISIWILMYREHRHGRSKLNKWMLATATTMFVLAIAVSCTPFQRAL